MKTKKERIAVSEEPEEWRRFKELAAKVMKAPPMPRKIKDVEPLEPPEIDATDAC